LRVSEDAAVPSMLRLVASVVRRVLSKTSIGKLNLSASSAEKLQSMVALWVKDVHNATGRALQTTKAEAAQIELAVTHEALSNLPQSLLSRVKVAVGIENYEWTQSQIDDEGTTVNKLSLR
jgi:hypothetical protein